MKGTAYYRILIAIETDATRYYGPNAARPAVLGVSDSEQLMAHLAADLKSLLPSVSKCSLIAPGALFDQTQILRPAYPVFSALEETSCAERAVDFRPGMVSVAARNGSMPVTELQPLEDIPLGLLQLLPVVVHGPADLVDELGQAMEFRFLEEGQVSPHSASWLESAFGVSISHARFMTLTDLNAMLRLQLDHFGFLPMWELLDAALNQRDETLRVQASSRQTFEWRDRMVHTQFQTFDYWANEGGGREQDGARQKLAEGYSDWTREMRQYLTTLKAHGVDLGFHLPGTSEQPLPGNFFIERGAAAPDEQVAAVTEHSFADLGTVAITLVHGGEQVNYYPLSAAGLNTIHAEIRRLLPGGHVVAFPGTLLYAENDRCLKPEPDSDQGNI